MAPVRTPTMGSVASGPRLQKNDDVQVVMLEAYCCPHASVLLWVHGLRNSRDAFEKVRVFVVILGNHFTMFLFL